MGEAKLLLPWGARTVIEAVVGQWRRSRVDGIVVVAHRDDDRLIALARGAGAEVVTPDVPPPDMKDSVAAGLEYASRRWTPTADDAWLLAPADMPWLDAAAVDLLVERFAARSAAARRDAILVPCFEGRRGHPVLFSWTLAEEVRGLGAGIGVNSLLARHPVELVPCVGRDILGDLDTPEDYRRLCDGSAGQP